MIFDSILCEKCKTQRFDVLYSTLLLAPNSSVVKRLAFPLFPYTLGAHLEFFDKLPTLTLFGLSLSGLSNKYHFRIESRFISVADNGGGPSQDL